MKRLLFILLAISSILTVSANDNRQKQINEIKKNNAYLYADVTKATPEEAVSHAIKQLKEAIIIWVSERTDSTNIQIADLKAYYDTIMTTRANMYRVLAYVKKENLLPFFKQYNLTLVDSLDNEKTIQTKPERKESSDTIANAKVRRLLKNNFLGRTGGVLDKIKRAKNFFELKEIMEPLKAKGDIKDYGKYATAENLDDCYLIIYDPAGNIKAILSKGTKERQNLKTGKPDLISNYRGCGAIWFTINENKKE